MLGVLLADPSSVPNIVLELTTTRVTCAKQVTAAERPAAVPTITSFGVSLICTESTSRDQVLPF